MTPHDAWLAHVERWKDCTRCGLCHQRSNIVLARGVVPCDVLFVGEAPGQSEDASGLPFKGPAGHLLDDIVTRAVSPGINCAYTNLVACYPREAKARGENEPEHHEILVCRPRLMEFIAIARPRLIVRVGTLAQNYLEHDAYGRVAGAEVVDIPHPAGILRKDVPAVKKQSMVQHAIVVIRNAVEDIMERGA